MDLMTYYFGKRRYLYSNAKSCNLLFSRKCGKVCASNHKPYQKFETWRSTTTTLKCITCLHILSYNNGFTEISKSGILLYLKKTSSRQKHIYTLIRGAWVGGIKTFAIFCSRVLYLTCYLQLCPIYLFLNRMT